MNIRSSFLSPRAIEQLEALAAKSRVSLKDGPVPPSAEPPPAEFVRVPTSRGSYARQLAAEQGRARYMPQSYIIQDEDSSTKAISVFVKGNGPPIFGEEADRLGARLSLKA